MKNTLLYFLCFLFLGTPLKAQQAGALYEDAMFFFAQKEYAAAYQKFQQQIAGFPVGDPRAASAQYYAAECLFQSGDRSGAILEYEKVVSLFRLSRFRESALHQLGLLYLDAANYDAVRERLIALLNDYPGSSFAPDALTLIGKSYVAEKDYESGAKFFETIIKLKQLTSILDYVVFNLAGVHEKKEDFTKAAELYEYVLTYFPNSPLFYQAQTRLGYCYFHLKDYESSIIELSNPSLKTLPVEKQAEALYMLGSSMYRTKNYKGAVTIFNEIIKAFPQVPSIRRVRYSLGWSHFQMGEFNEALKVFDDLTKESSTDTIRALSLFWKGETHRYMGNDNDALKVFQEFIRRYPESPLAMSVHYNVAVIYFNNQMYDKSAQFLLEAAKHPDEVLRARCNTLLGEIELNRGNYAKAQSYFVQVTNRQTVKDDSAARVIESEGITHRAFLGVGTAAYQLKQYDQAQIYFARLAEMAPSFEKDKVNFFRGECEFQRGNYREALRLYALVPKQNSDIFRLALYAVAYCHYNLGAYDDAAFGFEDFLKSAPDDQRANDARIRLADTYFATKKYANAARLYDELSKSGKQNMDKEYLLFQYSLSLYKAGKTQNAISEFNKIAKTYPATAHAENALYMIGWIAFQQNKFQDAITSYRKLLGFNRKLKNAPLVYYSIGDAYYNLGSYDSAAANYRIILEQHPGSSYVFDAVNGIQLCYSAQGKTDDAIATIEGYMQKNPASSFADQLAFQKGEIFYNLGDYQRAISEYQQFVRNYPSSKLVSKAVFATGKCLQYSGSQATAIEFFRQVLEQYPQSDDALAAAVEWSKMLAVQKDFEGALSVIELAVAKIKNEKALPELLYFKGLFLAGKGDTPAAYDVFDDIVVYHATSIFADKARLELGIIELRAKRFANASKHFSALLSNHTDELGAAAQYYSGMIFKEQGKFTDAITAFVRVVNTYPDFADWCARSYYLIGETYEALKDAPKAKEMFKIVVERFPSSEPAPFALKKLEVLK